MNLQDLVSSPAFIQLGMFFSHHVPQWIGYRLGWLLSEVVTRASPAPYRILRANLRQVLGPCADSRALEQTARGAFYTAIRSYFDLYRAMQLPQQERAAEVEFPDSSWDVVQTMARMERGTVLVFPHLGNFDLGGQATAMYIPEIQVITLPDPPAGFRLTNELRQQSGAQVTPLSPAALRQAIRLLRRGGVVSIAGDRPVSEMDEPYLFFGSPARVPSGHVRLALRTDSVIIVTYCVFRPETKRYAMYFDAPLEMIRTGDHGEEVQINMRRVLDLLEGVIRRWPEQWQMFAPVWPKLLEA